MLTKLLTRTVLVTVSAAALLISSGTGYAAPPKGKPTPPPGGFPAGSCQSFYHEGHELVKQGKLRQSMEWMLKCAQVKTCNQIVHKECMRQVSKIEADIPSIVPVVVDASGKNMNEVQVEMDGELLTSRLDGRGIPVDPGDHAFTFKTDKETLGTQNATIPQGQRNVAVTLDLSLSKVASTAPAGGAAPAAAEAAPEPAVATSSEEPRARTAAKSRGPGLGTYSLAVLGLAGVGGYGLLTYWGNKDNKLLDACKPDCKPSSVQHIRQLYTAGKISLGVGAAALVGATVLFLMSGSSSSGNEVASSGPSYQFGVAPTATGGIAGVSGAF